jgi:two-component system OmpR family response regulator
MWQALDRGSFDLVVLDVMLPGDDGLTLCRDLRAKSDMPVRDAHRARRRDRPHRRPGDGRRRLPAQALQRARTAGAHQGHPAPHAQPAAQPEAARRTAAALCRLDAGHRAAPTWSRPTAATPIAGAEYKLLRVFLDHPTACWTATSCST